MRTVAEGVEDAATALELGSLGVDELQGYHFARPMPPSEIPGWAATWRRLGAPGGSADADDVWAGQPGKQVKRSVRVLAHRAAVVHPHRR